MPPIDGLGGSPPPQAPHGRRPSARRRSASWGADRCAAALQVYNTEAPRYHQGCVLCRHTIPQVNHLGSESRLNDCLKTSVIQRIPPDRLSRTYVRPLTGAPCDKGLALECHATSTDAKMRRDSIRSLVAAASDAVHKQVHLPVLGSQVTNVGQPRIGTPHRAGTRKSYPKLTSLAAVVFKASVCYQQSHQ